MKVGDWVVCKLSIRPTYFNDRGHMDYLLGGKTRVQITDFYGATARIRCPKQNQYRWIIETRDFQLPNKILKGDVL